MRRMPTRTLTPARLAKELAGIARQLGDAPEVATAVFGRFVAGTDQQGDHLSDGPLCQIGELSSLARSIDLFTRIDERFQPVLPEGLLLELYLRELDGSARRRRGAYFTPRPLVQFIVRTVGDFVEQHFRDEPIHVIDPACGYGAFLWEVMHPTRPLVAALEPARPLVAAMCSGFEICPITHAIAQLLLSRTPNPESRAPTLHHLNPLTVGDSLHHTLLGPPNQPLVPVIVGNPPWSNFGRQNHSPWISELLADYRTGLAERKSNLTDDAIKFIRWGQHWIDQAGRGILALVTPNTWLDGLTHRRMRESLLRSFDELLVVDLHGEADGPLGDENVFGIRSGVAVVVMIRLRCGSIPDGRARLPPSRLSATTGSPAIRYASLQGSRDTKFAQLAAFDRLPLEELKPKLPDRRFSSRPASSTTQYCQFWPLDRIFRHYISGVQTKNDAVFVAFTRDELAEQVQHWLKQYNSPIEFEPDLVQPYLVSPFDRRWIYYDPRLIGRARYSVLRHMLRPNLGLVFMRQSTGRGEYDHFLAVDSLVSDRVFYSRHGAPFLAPLWLEVDSGFRVQGSEEVWEGEAPAEPASGGRQPSEPSGVRGQESGDRSQESEGNVSANLNPEFMSPFADAFHRPVEPIEVFHYLYAIAHSPTYRTKFAGELCRGFPRFPLPRDAELFERLESLGRQLVQLHVGGQPPEAGLPPAKNVEGEFRLGGYDVLRRWQTPRTKRGLTTADERELARLAWIGSETRRLMAQIDKHSRDQWSR